MEETNYKFKVTDYDQVNYERILNENPDQKVILVQRDAVVGHIYCKISWMKRIQSAGLKLGFGIHLLGPAWGLSTINPNWRKFIFVSTNLSEIEAQIKAALDYNPIEVSVRSFK